MMNVHGCPPRVDAFERTDWLDWTGCKYKAPRGLNRDQLAGDASGWRGAKTSLLMAKCTPRDCIPEASSTAKETFELAISYKTDRHSDQEAAPKILDGYERLSSGLSSKCDDDGE